MSNLSCFECGEEFSKDWAKENKISVPLCPACYDKLKHQLEDTVVEPSD